MSRQRKCYTIECIDNVYIHILPYYSAINKQENLAISDSMSSEAIALSKISQKKTNTVWSHLYVESKKVKFTEVMTRVVAAEDLAGAARGGGGKKEEMR